MSTSHRTAWLGELMRGVRPEFHRALLAWYRDPADPSARLRLAVLFRRLSDQLGAGVLADLFGCAESVIAALDDRQRTIDPELRRLLGRLDRVFQPLTKQPPEWPEAEARALIGHLAAWVPSGTEPPGSAVGWTHDDRASAAGTEPTDAENGDAEGAFAGPPLGIPQGSGGPALKGSEAGAAASGRIPEELLAIFAEEVEEESARARDRLAVWSSDPRDSAALTALRRRFGAIKGGAKVVGADAVADLVEAVEGLLGRPATRSGPPGHAASLLAEVLDRLPVLATMDPTESASLVAPLLARVRHLAGVPPAPTALGSAGRAPASAADGRKDPRADAIRPDAVATGRGGSGSIVDAVDAVSRPLPVGPDGSADWAAALTAGLCRLRRLVESLPGDSVGANERDGFTDPSTGSDKGSPRALSEWRRDMLAIIAELERACPAPSADGAGPIVSDPDVGEDPSVAARDEGVSRGNRPTGPE